MKYKSQSQSNIPTMEVRNVESENDNQDKKEKLSGACDLIV